MKKGIVVACLSLLSLTAHQTSSLTNIDQITTLTMQRLPDHMPYTQACFLGSYNAWANEAHGYFPFGEHSWSVPKQLEYGVRALIYETWYRSEDNLFAPAHELVILAHGDGNVDRLFRPFQFLIGRPSPTLFEGIQEVTSFLQSNPEEVITLFLNNHVEDHDLLDEALKGSGIDAYVFTPQDLAIACTWPTLGELRAQQKRLIIFCDSAQTHYCFKTNEHVHEHAHQEKKKNSSHLCAWYCFPDEPMNKETILTLKSLVAEKKFKNAFQLLGKIRRETKAKIDYTTLNSKKSLLDAIEKQPTGQATQSLLPNFIIIKHVEKGDSLEAVTAINQNRYAALIEGR